MAHGHSRAQSFWRWTRSTKGLGVVVLVMPSVVAPARLARAALAPALSLLQRDSAPASTQQATQHLAQASDALYRAELEARTEQAATHGIYLALEQLGRAVTLLSAASAGGQHAALPSVQHAVFILTPVARAARRPRHGEVLSRELSDEERRQLESGPRSRRSSRF